MNRRFCASLAAFCFLCPLIATSTVRAQTQPPPKITYIMPMGGQAGSTFELNVSGQDLPNVQGLHFSFPGVTVKTLGSESTTVPGMKKKRQQVTNLTTQKFSVTLPPTAPLGIQDVRIVTKAGISNPRAFVVGDLKEYVEQEPNDDVPKAQKIDLNSAVNGVIGTPTDVDYYVFIGKKGQRVVCSCLTTSIDSKLEAGLQLYSAGGSYLGFNRNYANSDAVLDATLPADGEYYVRVYCFTYTQGGVDNFYRLTVSTAPWIDAVFPPLVEPGKATQVTVLGRNLPGGKLDPTALLDGRPLEKAVVTIKTPNDPRALQHLAHHGLVRPFASMIDGVDYRMKNEAGSSNPFLMTYAPAPVVLDNGDNDEVDKAQKITVPCVIAGRIEKKADRDWYAFTAKKGQVWTVEAFADRTGAPMDLLFQLRNSQGNLIVEQDDTPEILSQQFYTRTDDPQAYRFVVPADGTYHLVVTSRDAYTNYGPRHLYTVRITPETPDFRLVAMATSLLSPEATTVNQEGGAAFNVYVWRFSGFNDDITLTGENLPPGVHVRPQLISAAQKQAVVVVHADAGAKPWEGAIKIVGTSSSRGRKLEREVRGASISWPVAQNNIPTITRLDRELVLAVRDKAPYRVVVGTNKITVLQGEKISIPVSLAAQGGFKTSVQVAAIGGPTGLNALSTTLAPNAKGTVSLDPKGNQPAAPGNYTIFVRGQTAPATKQPAPKGGPPNLVQISLPVTVTIVPKKLAKVTALPNANKLPVGKEMTVTVRVARMYDLPISFKVDAVLPPGAKGVSAKQVLIKAGEDEATLTIAASPQAVIGSNPTITIRATAMFNDTIPVVQETKLTLTITK